MCDPGFLSSVIRRVRCSRPSARRSRGSGSPTESLGQAGNDWRSPQHVKEVTLNRSVEQAEAVQDRPFGNIAKPRLVGRHQAASLSALLFVLRAKAHLIEPPDISVQNISEIHAEEG